jgi:uncharacterized membrane protein
MRINWLNLSTVASATILIGTMAFALAYATGWALGGLLGLGDYGAYFFEGVFLLIAAVALVTFVRSAVKAEPIFGFGE